MAKAGRRARARAVRAATRRRLDWQGDWSPLNLCVCARTGAVDAVRLLIAAGASVNLKTSTHAHTPLASALSWFGGEGHEPRQCLDIIIELLRAGASLDSCHGNLSAESCLLRSVRRRPWVADGDVFCEIEDLFREIRIVGPQALRDFIMAPILEILTLRGLASRGKIRSTDPKLNSLVALPNEVLCHVLGYWRVTN